MLISQDPQRSFSYRLEPSGLSELANDTFQHYYRVPPFPAGLHAPRRRGVSGSMTSFLSFDKRIQRDPRLPVQTGKPSQFLEGVTVVQQPGHRDSRGDTSLRVACLAKRSCVYSNRRD
jgi:hypothetical protein